MTSVNKTRHEGVWIRICHLNFQLFNNNKSLSNKRKTHFITGLCLLPAKPLQHDTLQGGVSLHQSSWVNSIARNPYFYISKDLFGQKRKILIFILLDCRIILKSKRPYSPQSWRPLTLIHVFTRDFCLLTPQQ